MATTPRKPRRAETFMTELMAEPIRMPGFPALIVTRHQARSWFTRAGWTLDQRTRQGQSVDRMVFLPAPVDQPLTDDATRERAFQFMIDAESARG